MICGALQTLNEDAFEDVASSERPSPSGLPTGEMLAAAAQLHLAPIRESSEFGSPSDELKIINNNLLPFVSNNNNNYNNNNTSNNYNNNTNNTTQQQFKQSSTSSTTNTTDYYNPSASSHSLHSLSGSLHMGNGITNTMGNGSTTGGGINNLRHSIIGGDGGGHLLSASNIPAVVGGIGLPQRHHSVGDDLLYEPLTPHLRTSSISSGIPTVVVIPNSNGDYATTAHHVVDDTKL